jgi:hypothetical protein
MPGLISAVTQNGNQEMHCLQRIIYCLSGRAVIGDFSLLWSEQFFLRYVSIIKVNVGVYVCLSVCGSYNLAESEDKSLKFWQLF